MKTLTFTFILLLLIAAPILAQQSSTNRIKLMPMDGRTNFATTEVTIDSNLARMVAK